MNFSNFFRFLGFNKPKPAATILPTDWPSYLHSKCSRPTCWFPNPPQVTEGTYHCQGRPSGFWCKGTYRVTSAMAGSTLKNYMVTRGLEDVKGQMSLDPELPNQHMKKETSRLSIFKRGSQKTVKESVQNQDYLNAKVLPPIPGLVERKVNRGRIVATTPAPVEPMYPRVVLRYYFPQDQTSSPSRHDHSSDPSKFASSTSRPLAPQRRPPSESYPENSLSSSPMPQQRLNWNQYHWYI